VRLQDLDQYIRDREASAAPAAAVAHASAVADGERLLPLSRIRVASARHLHDSWTGIPHVTHFEEADVTDLEAFRGRWNREPGDASRTKLTLLPFLVMATARVLREHPKFNARLDAEVRNLLLRDEVHMGIAVATDEGLVVPVIRSAQRKGLLELAGESRDLAEKARARRLPLDATQGGTFTITSLGGIGGTQFTPIINAPQVAILGVSRTVVRPWYDGAAFVPRTMLPLALSYDHRAVDGADAALFLVRLAAHLADLRLNLL
jgi:pyruvate dehydrogenase E2 component (dihydrolipoamide acetyltransferase)